MEISKNTYVQSNARIFACIPCNQFPFRKKTEKVTDKNRGLDLIGGGVRNGAPSFAARRLFPATISRPRRLAAALSVLQQEGQIIPDLRTGCIRARPCQITRRFSILHLFTLYLPLPSSSCLCAHGARAKQRRKTAARYRRYIYTLRCVLNEPR